MKKINTATIITLISFVINATMVATVYLAVINEVVALAFVALLASKWRIFAARPRFWLRNIVNNACDITFTASMIALIYYYNSLEFTTLVFALTGVLALWQLVIKVLRSMWAVGLQSLMCLFTSLTAIWTFYPAEFEAGVLVLLLTAVAAFAAAYHVLRQNEHFEGRTVLFSLVWSALNMQLAWLSWLWNVQYVLALSSFIVPQIALVSTVTGYYFYSVSSIRYRRKRDQHKAFIGNTAFYAVLAALIVIFSEWSPRIF